MPAAQAPFVSFNDYLDANAGSLDQERGGMISGAQGAVDKASADLVPMNDVAYKAGQDAGQASWSAQRAAHPSKPGQPGAITSSEQYQAPADPSTFKLTSGDMAKMPGFDQFTKDREAASQAVSTLGAGGLGQGKTAFEAGLLGADQGFQTQAAGVTKNYGDTVNNYLDTLNKKGAEGFQAFRPAPIQGTQLQPSAVPNQPGVTNMDPNMGPVAKPDRPRKVKTINGVPVNGQEELP